MGWTEGQTDGEQHLMQSPRDSRVINYLQFGQYKMQRFQQCLILKSTTTLNATLGVIQDHWK